MARLLWVLAALATSSAMAQTPCMFEGKEYSEPGLTDGIPNGAYTQNPYECQKTCAQQVSTIGCTGFVWKEASNPSQSIGPKGCWLVSFAAKLVDSDTVGTLGRVVSGPPECTTVTGTSSAPITTMTPGVGLTTAAPVVAVTTVPAVVVDTTMLPTGLNSTNITGGVDSGSSGFGGIPTWLILLILVAIVGLCIGAAMMQFGGKSKASKKKKKKTTRSSNDIEAEPPSVEAAPLLVEPASPVPASSPASPLPMAPMPGSPSLPVPSLTAPVLPMPGMAAAAAAPGYVQARQPITYMQPMYPGATVYAGGPHQILR